MANGVVELFSVRAHIKTGAFGSKGMIYARKLTLDGAGSQTLYTPDDSAHAVVLGMFITGADAAKATIKSGSTTLTTLDLPTNHILTHQIGQPVLIAEKGQPLVATYVAGTLTDALFYIAELTDLDLRAW